MYLKIYCDYCHQTWEAYPRDDLTRSKANRCPHCGAAKIDPETWEEIVGVLMRTKRVNEKLAADAEKLLQKITRDKKRSAVLVVNIYAGGRYAVKDLLVDGKPILQLLRPAK